MKIGSIVAPFFLLFLSGCMASKISHEPITSIQITDRNGFKETISSVDRLAPYERTDFLDAQPYERVVRMFAKNGSGKTPSKLTTYHENGQLWQYLEVINGRAFGVYREWYSNGILRLDVPVIEGTGDVSEEAQLGWVFDGKSRAWDEQGNLIAEIYYERGLLQGNAYYYHSNGTLSKVVPYEKDLIDGDVLYYSEKEELIGKTPYKKGKRSGIATYKGDALQPSYSEAYVEDLLLEATYHDFSGKIIGTIENGSGSQVIYKEGALHMIQEYRDGIPQGEVKIFHPQGYLETLFHVKDGLKHGEEWVYYPTSPGKEPRAKLYLEWYEDTIQGITRTWYPNGVLESEREMAGNQKQGLSSAWYQDGTLMLVEEYEKDCLKKGRYMKKGEPHLVSSVENGEGTATLFDPEGHFLNKVSYQGGKVVEAL